MKGVRACLRPISDADIDALHAAELADGMLHRWRFGGVTPTRSEYAAALWRDVTSQFVVVGGARAELVGLVAAYRHDVQNGHAFVLAARFAEGLGATVCFAEGFALFIDYLFSLFDLRKLYFESPQYNLAQFGSAIGPLFEIEAIRVGEVFALGEYFDVMILSIERERWVNHRSG